MEKNKYKQIVEKHKPKENRLKNGTIAFVVGGLMGVLGEFLVELYAYYLNIPTKEAGTFMIITLIFVGCLLTCLGFFDKLVKWAGAGLIVPITGFAHAMMSAALDYRKEGMVTGLGANMFKLAGSVIVFGVVSAYVFGLIRLILFEGAI
jgi:stage V sporulation protein AC